jgi:very-short-patch-repair endonuclease
LNGPVGDVQLAALAESQLGLVTRQQARAHLTPKQLRTRLATGRLEPVRWGVYRFAGSPPPRWQGLAAATLAAGPGAVASHLSAGELWDLRGAHAGAPELTVPWPLRPRLPGVRCHQSLRLPDWHRTVRYGVPVTTAARTLADLTSLFPAPVLGRFVDDALRRRVVTLDQLRAANDDLAARGRRRLTVLAAVLEARGAGFRPGDSPREVDLARLLVRNGLPPPVQQHQVVVDGRVYLLDLAYPDLLVGIEYDGWDAHGSRSAFDHDAARYNALQLAGWSILRFTSAAAPTRIVADVKAARARALGPIGPSRGNIRGFEPAW